MNHNNQKKKRQNKQINNKTKVLIFIGTILLICPILLLILTNHFLLDAPDSAWIVIGCIGSFIIGIGLFNSIMSLNKLSLGIKFTITSLLVGFF